jgi:lipid II:glycine glycyltransferase (peptidoglycan interpeptide bridge formation enzyme)
MGYSMVFYSLNGLFQEKFLENKINYLDIFKLVRYFYPKVEPVFGFTKRDKYTKVIDLNCSLDYIFANFRKNTRYEIKRAKKEGIRFEIEDNIEVFFKYYNEFANSKNYELLLFKTLQKYKQHIFITKALKGKKILSMHAYILGKDRVILLYSASLFRTSEDKKYRNLVGYANRFLHFEDICYFKKHQYHLYDFGGYAMSKCNDELQDINYFKDSFGGELLYERIYTSYMLNCFLFLKKIVMVLGFHLKKV